MQFLRGAKIGVLGLNGSGKSTLLKIIAGIETEFDGSVWVKDNIRVGYLPQEPQLDPTKDVAGNIRCCNAVAFHTPDDSRAPPPSLFSLLTQAGMG